MLSGECTYQGNGADWSVYADPNRPTTTSWGYPVNWYANYANAEQVTYTSSDAVTNWGVWNYQYCITVGGTEVGLSPEEALRLQQQAVREARDAHQQNVLAMQKAEELLLLHLTPEQQKSYKSKGYFETAVNDKRYRLYKGRSGNIKLLNKENKEVQSMCVHPCDSIPDHDTVLAQLLALHTNESLLVRTANITRLV